MKFSCSWWLLLHLLVLGSRFQLLAIALEAMRAAFGTYMTAKTVVLQDYRLGILFRLFQLSILLYVLVYVMLISKRYMRLPPL